ncbi:MAG: MalY/PatB family protein [Oceanobacter sp.]
MPTTRFDFDTPVNRQGSGCYKWDSNPDSDTLPMYVADMDFKTPDLILEALHKRVDHGVFGYTWVKDDYLEAVQSWFSKRYQFELEREWILPSLGIVAGLSALLRELLEPGDGVIVQTPVYHCFFSSIRSADARIVQNPLKLTNDRYQIDFNDLEQKAADASVKVMLLCHPHNPSGRVWTQEELVRIGEICQRNDVLVVSDEIHCDLLFPGETHLPYAKAAAEHLNNSITLQAPGKSFNLAGLQIANIIIPNPKLRSKVRKALHRNEVHSLNPFGIEASIAAYQQGEDWLEALKTYLHGNFKLIESFLAEQLPELKLYPQQATYLAWIDCSATGLNGDQMAKRLLDEGNLRISSGMGFLPETEQENHFIRLNFGCPRATVEEGLKRLKTVLSS